MVSAWELDPKQPTRTKNRLSVCIVSIFIVIAFTYCQCYPAETTLHDVRLQLAEEDDREARWEVISSHQVSVNTFLLTGIELEGHPVRFLSPVGVLSAKRRFP